MSIRQFLISTVAVFGVIYAMDFVWHGILLDDIYKKTAKLWRPEREIMDLFSLCVISHLITSLLIVSLFKHSIFSNKRDITLKHSILAGLTLGAIIGTIEMTSYIYMPISFSLAAAWCANRLIQGLGIGVALYFLNKPKPGKSRRSNNRGPRRANNPTAKKTTDKAGSKTENKTRSKPAARRRKASTV